MAVEIRSGGLTRGQSRRLRRDPEGVYQSADGTREYRFAAINSGEFPYSRTLLVRRFDYVNGQWRAGSEGATFSDSDRSRRSIAVMAINRGCTKRRI